MYSNVSLVTFSCIAECRPLLLARAGATEAMIIQKLGSSIEICTSLENHCNQPNNNNYILLQENHHTGRLDVVSQQEDYISLSNVQLNTSGIYCAYKQCAPEDMEQCCIRIIG